MTEWPEADEVRLLKRRLGELRWLHWCRFLGVSAPAETREAVVARLRSAYDTAVAAARATSSSLTTLDPNKFNPLSKVVGNPWEAAHKDSEQMEEIWKDVTRTFPERELFQSAETQKSLQRVLFTWGKKSNKPYRQGLNEIVAIIFHAVNEDAGPDDREPITYHVYDKLMSIDNVGAMFFGSGVPDENFTAKRCESIFSGVIKREAPEIHKHLDSVAEVAPSLFLLRWTRLLFAREFHIEDVIKLWDIFFADYSVTGKFDLPDYTALAMVQFVGKDLLRSDNSGCLRRLLKFPPVSDVTFLTKQAIAVRDGIVFDAPVVPVPPAPASTVASLVSAVTVAPLVKSVTSFLSHDVWEEEELKLSDVIAELETSPVAAMIAVQITKLLKIRDRMEPLRKYNVFGLYFFQMAALSGDTFNLLLAHGILMIIVFFILAPLAIFAIKLGERRIHIILSTACVLTTLIGLYLIPEGRGNSYSKNGVGAYHTAIAGTCFWGGVFLGCLGLFHVYRANPLVKTIHGFFGYSVALLTPFAMWTGWVALDLPGDAFTSSPIIFLLPIFAVLVWIAVKQRIGTRVLPFMNSSEIALRVSQGARLVVWKGKVLDVARFAENHPGGEGAIMRHIGADITEVFSQVASHSNDAADTAASLAIAVVADQEMREVLGAGTAHVEDIVLVNNTVKQFKLATDAVTKAGERLFIYLPDSDVFRPYTAIQYERGTATFAIKMYSQGKLTSYLNTIEAGESLKVKNSGMADRFPSAATSAILIAGGTGITPMYAMLLQKPLNCQVVLLWWLKTFDDIFLLDRLGEILKRYKDSVQIKIFISTDGPLPSNSKGGISIESGKLEAKVFSNAMLWLKDPQPSVWCSGPPAFVKAVKDKFVIECELSSARFTSLD